MMNGRQSRDAAASRRMSACLFRGSNGDRATMVDRMRTLRDRHRKKRQRGDACRAGGARAADSAEQSETGTLSNLYHFVNKR